MLSAINLQGRPTPIVWEGAAAPTDTRLATEDGHVLATEDSQDLTIEPTP